MKIAYLFGSLNRGGTETLMLDCFKNASKATFQMIAIYRKGGNLLTAFQECTSALYKLSPKHTFDILYFIRLRRLLKKEQISIVHAQQAIDAMYAWMATRGTSIKIMLTLHGYDFRATLLEKIILKFILKKTTQNIYVSQVQKVYYEERYKLKEVKQKLVYNGISFSKFDLDNNNISLRQYLGIGNDTLLLGTVGNFVAGRDPLTICRFLDLLQKEQVDFRFLFVGKKNDAEAWRYDECVCYCKEHNLEEKIQFLGARTDVPSILNQLDTFIYSTEHDTFGIAVIEAIASKIPTFVNDWDVMKEVTENGKLAILYKTKDETDLMTKFLHYNAHKDLYVDSIQQADTIVRKKYSIEVFLQHLSDLYHAS